MSARAVKCAICTYPTDWRDKRSLSREKLAIHVYPCALSRVRSSMCPVGKRYWLRECTHLCGLKKRRTRANKISWNFWNFVFYTSFHCLSMKGTRAHLLNQYSPVPRAFRRRARSASTDICRLRNERTYFSAGWLLFPSCWHWTFTFSFYW